VAKLRGTKLRALTVFAEAPKELPSRARPHKPPAKAISARKAAGVKIDGGKIPPKASVWRRGRCRAAFTRSTRAENEQAGPRATESARGRPVGTMKPRRSEMRVPT
jgi:hypothetical protein